MKLGLGRGRVARLGVVALFGAACAAKPPLSVSSVSSQAQQNELSAVAAYRGKRMRIAGVVTQTGLKKVDMLVGEGTYGYWSSKTIVRKGQRSYPYLYAQDPTLGAEGGQLLCFFGSDWLERLAKVQNNDHVVLEGDFQEFTHGGTTIVLRDCELSQ